MKKQRNHYAPEEKVAILRRHLLEKEPALMPDRGTAFQVRIEPPDRFSHVVR